MARYERWLSEQRLTAETRRSYRRWVAEMLEDLAGTDPQLGVPNGRGAKAGREREAALRDWRRRLVDRRLAPSTVNLALAAAASLLDALRLLEHDHGVLRPTRRAEATFRAPPDRRHLR